MRNNPMDRSGSVFSKKVWFLIHKSCSSLPIIYAPDESEDEQEQDKEQEQYKEEEENTIEPAQVSFIIIRGYIVT